MSLSLDSLDFSENFMRFTIYNNNGKKYFNKKGDGVFTMMDYNLNYYGSIKAEKSIIVDYRL